uniref:Uncharacterized protein n=1 Tax=Ignisphaera aggregans TaxID=334771 RepID=A0A7C5TIX6_9CREN
MDMNMFNAVQNKGRVELLVAYLMKDTGIIEYISIGSIEFKIAVQKFVYLLQVVGGLDLGFKFEWLSMGPYSKGLQNYYQKISRVLTNNLNRVELNAFEQNALEAVKRLLFGVKDQIAKLDVKTLEIVASLVMLCRDVYPKPLDPVEELIKRKKLFKEDVLRIWRVIDKFGICI